MAKTKEEILSKYYENFKAKIDIVAREGRWEAAKSRMIDHFKDLPFNDTIKRAYEERVRAAKWRKPDPEKARDNYEAKMF